MRLFFPRSMVVALLVIAAATPAFAVGFHAGLKAGYTATNLSGEIPDLGGDFAMRNGFTGGVFFDFNISERISIQIEGTYVQRGSWIRDIPFIYCVPEYGCFSGTADYEFRLWYFDFPVLAKFTMRKGSFLSPFLYTGPVYSYCHRSVIEVAQTIDVYTWNVRDDIAGLVKSKDFGVIFGGGLNLDFGGFMVFFEGRYTLGLRNLNATEEDFDLKNRAIGALLGVSILFSE